MSTVNPTLKQIALVENGWGSIGSKLCQWLQQLAWSRIENLKTKGLIKVRFKVLRSPI
jgi:hypothetical protein